MCLEMKKAIVFNCHYNGLAIIQELGSKGVECIAMDSKRGIGTYSKFAKFVQVADPAFNEEKFIYELYRYCENENEKPVLFPTNDHWAIAISKSKESLKRVSIPIVADYETVKLLIEKNRFYQLGAKNNYLTPLTWAHTEIDNITKRNFPIIAKPEYRRNSNIKFNHHQLDQLRFTIISNKNELEKFCLDNSQLLEAFLFQEYIPGDSSSMYTLGIYADNDFEFADNYFWGRKVRGYPAEFGDWVVGESGTVPDEILKLSRQVVKDIKYHGIAELEFKYNSDNHQYKLIEINPRSWSWIGITQFSGASLPTIAYSNVTKIKLELKEQKTKKKIRYTKILDDTHFSFWKYKKEYPKWKKNIFQLFRDYRGKKTYCAEFLHHDYKVMCIAIYRKLREIIKSNDDKN